MDPAVVEYLSNPNAVLLQNKVLTIVFWDISSFSILCEKLINHPELVAEFLREYLGVATKIIHEHMGIVDKFIGDGILHILDSRKKILIIMDTQEQKMQYSLP